MAEDSDNESSRTKHIKLNSELDEFDDIFPELVDFLTKDGFKNNEIRDAIGWFKEVSEYNVPFGKKNRGISVVTSYKYLVEKPTNEDLKLARILGWCVEWLQAFFLVADDIMDHSITRRGKPCWYKKGDVRLIAINDAFYLENCIYQILKQYFRSKQYYIDIVDLFHETTMQTVTGQCLDLITAPVDGKIDFAPFTLDRYNAIVKWKTAYYSFYLPVALAMYMANIVDEATHSSARVILLEMGKFFQIQDDYLDCYGDPDVIGKIGTDIEDNKCSWLVVQALRLANEEQLQILQESYGQTDQKHVASVKRIFSDLQLEKTFKEYEEESFQEIMNLIEKHKGSLPSEMFLSFAYKIYKRQK